jgi:hypothetical protein
MQCRFLGFQPDDVEPIKEQACQDRHGGKPERTILPHTVTPDLVSQKQPECVDGIVQWPVLRQDEPVAGTIIKIGRHDRKKAPGSKAARRLDNIKFEIQAHQIALVAVSLQPQQLIVLHEAFACRGRRGRQFPRDVVDPVRQHPSYARDNGVMPAAPGLDIRQCVIEVAVERTVVGATAAGGLAVDEVVQAYVEEVGDGEQPGEAGPVLLADVLCESSAADAQPTRDSFSVPAISAMFDQALEHSAELDFPAIPCTRGRGCVT